ncbi:MAG TPA: trimethylamine methyltransferase, partial [Aliiroseovarius sp.]|nr:trimethylamine methyltransferase [Aliiroseovarius sp.]
TQANFKNAFWRSDVLDNKPFETWEDDGARDTQALAAARAEALLAAYEKPPIDPGTEEALRDYVARKKAAMPDAFG